MRSPSALQGPSDTSRDIACAPMDLLEKPVAPRASARLVVVLGALEREMSYTGELFELAGVKIRVAQVHEAASFDRPSIPYWRRHRLPH